MALRIILGSVLACFGLVFLFQEKIYIKIFRAHPFQLLGFADELQGVRVYFYQNPHVHAHAMRGLFGTGILILSQGALVRMGEEHLGKVVLDSTNYLKKWTVVLEGYFSLLAFLSLKLAPKAWVRCLIGMRQEENLAPLSFIVFVFFYGIHRFFVSLAHFFGESDYFHLESLV